VEHLFSVEARFVTSYHEYFRACVKFRMGPSSFACYHHQTSKPEVCLRMCWQKKYPKMVFSHSTLPVVINILTTCTIHGTAHTSCTAYILITNFLKKKILDKKILVILLQFTKFAKIFSLQNFVSYSILKDLLTTV